MAKLIFVWCLIFFFSDLGRTAKTGRKVEKEDSVPTGHLIGGRNAQIEKYPYQTSQRTKSRHNHFCGGAIISEKFVITAAHCICNIKSPMSSFYIWVGSTTLSGLGYKYDIEHAICHSNYDPKNMVNDIGIIGVVNSFYFKFNVKPIKIYMNEVPPGTKLTVSGWGVVSYPITTTDVLQKIKVPALSLQQCRNQFSESYAVYLNDKIICTLLPTKPVGTCKGDSGGPLTFNGKLVGLVSWGIPCAAGKPDVYTKVAAFKPWLTQILSYYCQIRPCSKNAKFVHYVRRSRRVRGLKTRGMSVEVVASPKKIIMGILDELH